MSFLGDGSERRAWSVLERLSALQRAPASTGEETAAMVIATELKNRGARVRLEPVSVHGTYWIPLGLGCAAAVAAAFARSVPGAFLSTLAGISIADDLSIGRRPLRRWLGQRIAHNVLGEFGPADPLATIVIHAHHDAAHTGLVFHPKGAKLVARVAGGLMEHIGGTPPPMWGAVAGPAAVAAGHVLRRRWLRRMGAVLSAGYGAAMADIWRSPAVPAANDNLSGVWVLLALAEELAQHSTERTRVLLLSTGSEESFLEAMVGFGNRHFDELPRASSIFLCLESVGSPHLMLLSGEGLLRLRRYPTSLIQRISLLAQEQSIQLRRPFKYRLATDGQVPLRSGYATAVLSSMDWYKAPSNYHWRSDTPENLQRGSISAASRLALALIRDLDKLT